MFKLKFQIVMISDIFEISRNCVVFADNYSLSYSSYLKQLTSTRPWRILTNIATTKLILAAAGSKQFNNAEINNAMPKTLKQKYYTSVYGENLCLISLPRSYYLFAGNLAAK